jgi:hypothetical protein
MASKPTHHILIAMGIPRHEAPSGLPPSTRGHFMPDQGEPDQDDMAPTHEEPDGDEGIDQSGIQGEPGTGYEGPEGGAFACGNCQHMEQEGTCNEPHMIKLSQQPRGQNGHPTVDAGGCCEFVNRGGAGGEEAGGQPAMASSRQPPGIAIGVGTSPKGR